MHDPTTHPHGGTHARAHSPGPTTHAGFQARATALGVR